MSSFSKTSQLQATSAVNSLLSNILPGSSKIKVRNEDQLTSRKKQKKSKAQLIDQNLKKRVELQERDVFKIKKKEKKQQKNKIKSRKVEHQQLDQLAKLEVLKKHKKEGTLTPREQEYLNKVIKLNTASAKSWELDDEEKEELKEIQKFILDKTTSSRDLKRKSKRRNKVKQFKEDIKQSTNNVSDHRYPGLTPGLAPVGLSDEEESSEEDDNGEDY
ncbi:hypothetical protein NCAS_0G02950 [Naumovozyma castellii]|uniref:Regulator of rDNA transcription 14 n=1 Tax=Naumovozyma castellii TaxID=27288 RepID=G0VIE7_NAUCA|nr:hypothetical protein NCAS_0G02950 [Naumovozyma castellii CBS 4309]CCC71182.1 hypothetical protein NCAS_0G02950 [Naumovozyma castellii CBS 4309]